ncbi:MAG: glycosyltransferase [Candidatus Omnitrophota bacterium]
MKAVDILAYKVESFDSDCFSKDIAAYDPDSIVLFFDPWHVWCAYAPPGCGISGTVLSFFRFKKASWNYYLFPFIFVIDQIRLFGLFVSLCLRYRIRTMLVENTYGAVIAGILRKTGIVKRLFYLPGDWLAGHRGKKQFLSFLGNNVIFPLCDYLACVFSDVTLDCTWNIAEARARFWGRHIAAREIVFQNRLEVKRNYDTINIRKARAIAFIGNARPDSGLDLVIRAIADLKNDGFFLKIAGFYNQECRKLEELAGKLGVKDKVMFAGFSKRADFPNVLSDCFCGVNILTSPSNYSAMTLPSKLFDYFQFLLPVIATENAGYMSGVIREHKLGIILHDLNPDSCRQAVVEIFEKQDMYRKSLIEYINVSKGTGVKDILAVQTVQ